MDALYKIITDTGETAKVPSNGEKSSDEVRNEFLKKHPDLTIEGTDTSNTGAGTSNTGTDITTGTANTGAGTGEAAGGTGEGEALALPSFEPDMLFM